MIQKQKGTMDLYGLDGSIYKYIEGVIDSYANLYNYEYIKVPTFEATELFYRGMGETTDVVNKETYDFVDKGDRKITLRPEFTAGVVRSYIENKLYVDGVKKFYYFGSSFRYERPQSGRLREFTQAGVEVFGIRNPKADAEVISIAYNILSALGITDLVVKINSIGDSESRNRYSEAVREYFKDDYDNLCDVCKERLTKNPLRILDCKYDSEREYVKNAPMIKDYLNDESKEYFDKVKECLDLIGIPYVVEDTLVRGLDYYTDTVFEIACNLEELGKANTVAAGGRYDNLVSLLDGPATPGVGFAFGVERIIILLKELECFIPKDKLDVFVINMDETGFAYQVIDDLRGSGYSCETDYTGKSFKNIWKVVDKYDPSYIIIIGEDEVKGGFVTVKDNSTKEETKVKSSELLDYLDMNL